MRLAVLALLVPSLLAQQRTTITGTFANPDNTLLTGTLLVQPGAASASYTCGTGGSAVLSNSIVKITNGVLGALSLIPSSCLSPANGGSVLGLSVATGGKGYSGTCIATLTGPAVISQAQATCGFSSGALTQIQLIAHGTFQSTIPPTVAITCQPACTPTTIATVKVIYTPGQLYTATVVDKNGQIMFSTKWSIPNASTIDVTQLQ